MILDLHALTLTPGAAGVYGSPGVVAANDGCPTAGVPLDSAKGKATLRMWGFHAPTADTINVLNIYSQDMVDPKNGITMTLGAASLLTQWYDYTTLVYQTGARIITAGTNTGVVAGTAWTLDSYEDAESIAVRPNSGNEVCPPPVTFGGALTTNQWGTVVWNPTNPIPAGRYALIGAVVTAITNNALIRFAHSSFKGKKPGFPVVNAELGLVATEQISMRDELVRTAIGEQFIYLSDQLDIPCCPVFDVGPGATGLTIEMNSVQADTPVVHIMAVKLN